MNDAKPAATAARNPVILVAAVLQGAALYALHRAVTGNAWPATHADWLLAFYALVTFAPLTLQLLVEHATLRRALPFVAVIAASTFYFGWHHGHDVVDKATYQFDSLSRTPFTGLQLAVLWLMALPFVQCRLITQSWQRNYALLFACAWRNVLMLAEAALFTVIFWLLLFLWQKLFDMVGIGFFRELFREPLFIYPVTSLTFGCALQLIGSVDRFTSAVLDQLLNVLKWLALPAGTLLVLFTLALAIRLPALVVSGQKAIGAPWLLWLIAVMVLLLNAAYRDGRVSEPYPRAIARLFRFVAPVMVVVAVIAAVALVIRIHAHGFTVERIWGLVVAGAGVAYSVGYAFAGFDRASWFGGMARVNVVVALLLIATLCATLTPLLSPYRLAANSQYRLAHDARRAFTITTGYSRTDPLRYLRFESGSYGVRRLEQLAMLREGSDAPRIRERAAQLLAQKDRWVPESPVDIDARIAQVVVYPRGRAIDAGLRAALQQQQRNMPLPFDDATGTLGPVGLFIDMDRDGSDEFVLIGASGSGSAFAQQGDDWASVGFVTAQTVPDWWPSFLARLDAGDYAVLERRYQDFAVGPRTFRLTPRDITPP